MDMNRLQSVIAVRGNLSRLAELAKVSHSTILKIARGETRNPGYLTVQAIEAGLKQMTDLPEEDSQGRQPTDESDSGFRGRRRQRAREELRQMRADGVIRPGATLDEDDPTITGDHK